jgi:hypothetical protein
MSTTVLLRINRLMHEAITVRSHSSKNRETVEECIYMFKSLYNKQVICLFCTLSLEENLDEERILSLVFFCFFLNKFYFIYNWLTL